MVRLLLPVLRFVLPASDPESLSFLREAPLCWLRSAVDVEDAEPELEPENDMLERDADSDTWRFPLFPLSHVTAEDTFSRLLGD
jgi:hypothetical protein